MRRNRHEVGAQEDPPKWKLGGALALFPIEVIAYCCWDDHHPPFAIRTALLYLLMAKGTCVLGRAVPVWFIHLLKCWSWSYQRKELSKTNQKEFLLGGWQAREEKQARQWLRLARLFYCESKSRRSDWGQGTELPRNNWRVRAVGSWIIQENGKGTRNRDGS